MAFQQDTSEQGDSPDLPHAAGRIWGSRLIITPVLRDREISEFMKLFPFTCTADTFQKLSKAYSILTDPAAKVVTNLLLDVWLYGSVDAVCSGCV